MVGLALAGSALINAGSQAGWFGGKKGKYEVDPYGQLNPDQKALSQQLGPYFQSKVGSTAPTYTGQYAADMTPEEQAAIQQQSRLSALSEGWSNKFQPGVIDQEVADTERRALEKDFYGNGFDPGLKALTEEQFAGPGGYWGSARAKGVVDAYNTGVVDPYQKIRSGLLQNSYQNALGYMSNQSGVNAANITAQAIPRAIKQYGLDKAYEEWTRGQNMSAQYVDQALKFMGVESATSTYKPAEPSFGSALADNASSMLNAYSLSQMFKDSGKTTNPGNTANYNALMNIPEH